MVRSLPVVLALACCTAALLSGCAALEQLGEFQHISNRVNSFQYGGSHFGKDGTESYAWNNTAGCGVVQWAGQLKGGSFSLRVLDADGTEVFTGDFADNASSGLLRATRAGAPGTWTVDVIFHDLDALMGLNLFAGNNAGFTRDGGALLYGGQTCQVDSARANTLVVGNGTATIEWGGQALEGTFTFLVKDASGKTVGSWTVSPGKGKSFSAPLTGSAGTWTLQVTMADFTGQAGLRVTPT